MSELDDKLNSILNNPQMMQQIMSLAQSMNGPEPQPPAQPQPPQSQPPQPPPPKGGALFDAPIDPSLLSKIAGLMQRSSIDQDQAQLLKALRPFLSGQKLQKLERAMHAAKMAGIASDVVGIGGHHPFSGR